MNRSTNSNVIFHNFSDSHLIPLTNTHSKIADEGSSVSVDSPPSHSPSWRQVGPQNAITDPLTEQWAGWRPPGKKKGGERQPNVCMIIRVDNYRLEIPTHTILIKTYRDRLKLVLQVWEFYHCTCLSLLPQLFCSILAACSVPRKQDQEQKIRSRSKQDQERKMLQNSGAPDITFYW